MASVQLTQVYSVGMLFHDVEDADCLEHMVDSLKYLDGILTQMFDRVGKRVETERARLAAINARVNNCQAKVAGISSRKSKATTIFSNAKYPGAPELADYQPLYHDLKHMEEPDLLPSDEERNCRYLPADLTGKTRSTADELLDILWRANQTSDGAERPGKLKDGLGNLPQHLPSVSSLLLFNSNETPYTEYNHLDNLGALEGVEDEPEEEEDDGADLAAAPESMLDGFDLPAVAGLDNTYKPTMKEQPELNFASGLDFGANLPDVAQDLVWSAGGADVGSSIAPSVFQVRGRSKRGHIKERAARRRPGGGRRNQASKKMGWASLARSLQCCLALARYARAVLLLLLLLLLL